MNSIFTTPKPETHELVAEFTVTGEPVSKSRARFTKRGSKTFAYTPQKTLDGETAIKAAYLSATQKIGTDKDAAFAVRTHFFNGTRQRRDVDNMVKLVLDGLNEVAWPDDNQVLEIAARKSYVKKAEARTEVQVFLIGAMEHPVRVCPQCGSEFRVYESTPDKAHCSGACMSASRAATRVCICKNCGVSFDGLQQKYKPKYCSMECKSIDLTVEVSCSGCGDLFRKPKSQSRNSTNFCSMDCKKKHDLTCPKGHLWTEHIRYRTTSGHRYCAECIRIRQQAAKAKRKTGPDMRVSDETGPASITIHIKETQ